MPILLFTLLFSACLGGDFDSRVDPHVKVVTPTPTPTDAPQVGKCLASCQEACGAWGTWSELSPATDTVCQGKKLTQSQERTRTCVGTCAEVTCPETETNEVEVDGTKDCPHPPPPCQTSCKTGCQDWGEWSEWSPTQDSKFTCIEFTQTRDRKRQCFPTCDAKADCICTGITCAKTGKENKPDDVKGTKEIDCDQACDKGANDITWGDWTPQPQAEAANMCKDKELDQTRTGTFSCPRDTCKQCNTETKESRTLVGTKVTDCQADNSPYCEAWQPALIDCVWTPAIDLSTKYEDETFTQTCKQVRTCPRACPGSVCKTEKKPATRTVTGTQKRPKPKVVKEAPDPDPEPPAITCNTSCSASCDAWGAWGDWSAWGSSASCPSSDYFGAQQEPKQITETRSRDRKCKNLCLGIACFTSNSETRVTPCAFCTGANQATETDGTCGCKRTATEKYYRVGDVCVKCEDRLVETGGTWTCIPPANCGNWVVQSVFVSGSEVCKDWDATCQASIASGMCGGSEVTPVLTLTRECTNCTAADNCSTTTTRNAKDKVQGTKTTPCQSFCTWEEDWGHWQATGTCPAGSRTSRTRHTIQGLEKQKLISCKPDLCPNSGCLDKTRQATRYCLYCEGEGMKKKKAGTAAETCECDDTERYYPDGDSCTKCPADKEFKQVNGVWQCNDKPEIEENTVVVPATCDSNKREYLVDGTCTVCQADKDFKQVNGVWQCNDKPTCANSCDDKWGKWSDWQPAQDAQGNDTFRCPTNTATSKPEEPQQKDVRSRSRNCDDAAAELGCFTHNEETRLTRCDYCLGTGMKKDKEGTAAEICVCDAKDNYYEKNGICVQCAAGEILNTSKDGCVCDAVNNFYLQGGSCVECNQPNKKLVKGECVCDSNKGYHAEGNGCVCDENNDYYLQDGECVLCNQPNRELVNDSCDCIAGYEEVTQADGAVACQQITCDSPKKLVNGKCVCNSDSGYIPDPDGDGCICNASSGYYEYMGSCVLCNQPNKKLVNGKCVCDSSKGYRTDGSGCACDEGRDYYDYMGSCLECQAPKKLVNGECREEVAAAPSHVEPQKADNCKDGCLAWSKWSSWSIPAGGAHCPSANAFEPPPANTDKKRTRSRTCPKLGKGVACFTTNTETKTCLWCQGMGQIFDDDGDCVCDVSRNFYKDHSTKPPTCKTCVAGKTPNTTGDGCICAETECPTNPKKEWDNINCKCGECKEDIVTACSYGVYANCECKPEPPPEPEEITVTLYHGCYAQESSALYMPAAANTLKRNKHHGWKLDCFSSHSSYEAAASTLLQATTDNGVTGIIQTLYDCAKEESEQDFMDKLTNNDGLCPIASDASNTYTITITP